MPSANYSVSIVIPNYNGEKILQEHLPAVLAAAPGAQLIVVDDASTDSSVAMLKNNYPQITVLTHKTNRRFAAACNTGVTAATGDIVILLNSDVSPHPDFLAPLLEPFTDPQVFAVGCKELTQEGDKVIDSGRAGGAFRRGLAIHWRMPDQTKPDTLWVSGGSGAFHRSLWLELGGMDPLFAPAYEEDRDISYRALKRGYKIKFAPNSQVNHHHETTNRTELGTTNMKVASYKNHLVFVWKNITDPKLFFTHLLWLPYHLIFTNIRSGGYFGRGFWAAIKQIPEINRKRRIELKESTVNDATIFASYQE